MLATVLGGSAGAGGGSSCFENNPTKHGKMKADVDGNGTPDLAWIAANKHSNRCRYFAKVDLGVDEARKRFYGKPGVLREWSHIMAMIEVDTSPGKEFGILFEGGATKYLGLFTMRAGNIERVKVNGRGATQENLFAYGGSTGAKLASDCARNRPDGHVIISLALLNDARTHYKVKRLRFQSTGVNVRTSEDTERRTIPADRLHERLYEFRSSPFGSCPGRAPG